MPRSFSHYPPALQSYPIKMDLPTPLTLKPATRETIRVDHFEVAFKRAHPGISRLGVSAHQIDDSVGGFVLLVVKPNGRTLKLDVDLSYSVKKVERVLADRDASVADQVLIFHEKALEDDKTLFDSNIGKGTVLHLRALQIALKMPDGELKVLNVERHREATEAEHREGRRHPAQPPAPRHHGQVAAGQQDPPAV